MSVSPLHAEGANAGYVLILSLVGRKSQVETQPSIKLFQSGNFPSLEHCFIIFSIESRHKSCAFVINFSIGTDSPSIVTFSFSSPPCTTLERHFVLPPEI